MTRCLVLESMSILLANCGDDRGKSLVANLCPVREKHRAGGGHLLITATEQGVQTHTSDYSIDN